jgi:hypothetical protein
MQRQMLRRRCSAAKEQLLADDGPERVAVTILGGGRSIVGGALSVELTRDQVRATLDEFLPVVNRGDSPAAPHTQRPPRARAALRERSGDHPPPGRLPGTRNRPAEGRGSRGIGWRHVAPRRGALQRRVLHAGARP